MTAPLGDMLRELRNLADTLGPALAPTSGQQLLTAVVRTARAIFGAGACSLALLTDDGAELLFTTVSGRGEDAVTGLRIPAARGIAGWVVMSGQSVAVAEPQRDPRFAVDVAESTGFGGALLRAAAEGAPAGALADALRVAAEAERGELADQLLLGAVVADLRGLGAAEQQLAVGILAQVTAYLGRREKRVE